MSANTYTLRVSIAIERLWSAGKVYLSTLEDPTYLQLKINFDHALYRVSVQEIRTCIQKTLRFMSVYKFVKTGPVAELVVKNFQFHRAVTKSDLAVYARQLNDKLASLEIETAPSLPANAQEERERIRRCLPEMEEIITVKHGGDEEQQPIAAVNKSVEKRAAQRLAKKRTAEVSAGKERERDLERSRNRRRTVAQDKASEKDRMDVDGEGSRGRMEIEK